MEDEGHRFVESHEWTGIPLLQSTYNSWKVAQLHRKVAWRGAQDGRFLAFTSDCPKDTGARSEGHPQSDCIVVQWNRGNRKGVLHLYGCLRIVALSFPVDEGAILGPNPHLVRTSERWSQCGNDQQNWKLPRLHAAYTGTAD